MCVKSYIHIVVYTRTDDLVYGVVVNRDARVLVLSADSKQAGEGIVLLDSYHLRKRGLGLKRVNPKTHTRTRTHTSCSSQRRPKKLKGSAT